MSMRIFFGLMLWGSLALGQSFRTSEAREPLMVASATDWVALPPRLLLGNSTSVETGGTQFLPRIRLTDQTSGINVVSFSTNTRICMNYPTCSVYLTYDGSSIAGVGASFGNASGAQLGNSSINGLGVTTFLVVTGAPLYMRGPKTSTYILNDNSTDPVFVNDLEGLCVGNGTGTECDGAMNAGTTRIGTAGTPISASIRGTAVIDFGSISVGACATSTITVTGAATGSEVAPGIPAASDTAGSIFTMWVSATNTVTVKHCCVANVTCDPASGTFAARVENP